MLQHTKKKSQFYNTFVISEVCSPSLCDIPIKTETTKNKSIHNTWKLVF